MQTDQGGIFDLTMKRRTSSSRQRTSFSSKHHRRDSSMLIKVDDTQMDPLKRIKAYKQEVKKVETQYLKLLSDVTQSQRAIGYSYRQAQRKKTSFIKLYETKKLKNLQNSLLQEKKIVTQKNAQQIRQNAKKIKIQEQIQKIVIKSQKEGHILKLRQEIQRSKQKIQKKKFLVSKKLSEDCRNNFLKIKLEEDQLKQRKRNIKSMQSTRAKHNYLRRVNDQVVFLEEYQNMLKDFQQNEAQIVPLTERTHGVNSFFLTQKRHSQKNFK